MYPLSRMFLINRIVGKQCSLTCSTKTLTSWCESSANNLTKSLNREPLNRSLISTHQHCYARLFSTSGNLYNSDKNNNEVFINVNLEDKSGEDSKSFRYVELNSKKSKSKKLEPNIEITFLRADGETITVKGHEGDTLLDVVMDNDIDLDGFGACEGTLSCSTCHLIFDKDDFDRIPNRATDEELDMLDLANDLTDTSRLGCQIYLTKELNGLQVRVPASVNDVRDC